MIHLTEPCPRGGNCQLCLKLVLRIISTKSVGLFVHSYHTARLGRDIGQAIGLTQKELDDLYIAGLLHDIGKINIPSTIFLKDARLTQDEMKLMQSHSAWGADLVESMGFFPHLSHVIRSHHETPDGSGYPDGLILDQIPLLTRIISVCDKFSAMTITRTYRACGRFSTEDALSELNDLLHIYFGSSLHRVEDVLLSYGSDQAILDSHKLLANGLKNVFPPLDLPWLPHDARSDGLQ